MLDRLQELKSLAGNTEVIPIHHSAQDPFITAIRTAQNYIDKVRHNSTEIKKLKDNFNKSTKSEQEVEINKSLRLLLTENNNELGKVRDIIEGLAKSVEESKHNPADVTARMKITMHATLVKQFQEALGESEQAQEAFDLAVRSKTGNQLRMMDENISDEMIERCIDDPKQAQVIVQSKLIGAHGDVLRMVNDIEDRLKDIKILEENITSMHKMFLDLAALVHAQGELLNSVEKHVDKAGEYVKQGEKALVEAKKHQEATRNRKCCILIIVLILLVVIVVPTATATSL